MLVYANHLCIQGPVPEWAVFKVIGALVQEDDVHGTTQSVGRPGTDRDPSDRNARCLGTAFSNCGVGLSLKPKGVEH